MLSAGIIATGALVVAAVLVGQIWWKLSSIEKVDIDELDEAGANQPQNFLIVGSDSREGIDPGDPRSAVFLGGEENEFGQRADTMVLVRYDPQVERLDILSVPRDLWVTIAGTSTRDRINTAFSYEDGPNRLIRTVQDALGVPVHHYAEVDFRGFETLVDTLGGVPMYFDTIYQDRNSGLVIAEPGCVNLDGTQALAFVRSRHLEYMTPAGDWESDPTGDLGRITRQQIFLRNALAKARGRASLLNPLEYNRMLDVAVDHLRMDSGLDAGDLAAMGQRYAEFEGDSVETHSLPVEEWTTPGGAAVLTLLTAEAQPVLNVFRGLPPDQVAPAWVDLQILNGSGRRNEATEARAAFEAIGFSVSSIGDLPRPEGEDLHQTTLRYAPGSERLAWLVERHLTSGAELAPDPSLDPAQVVLETGLDFTTVEQVPRAGSSPPPEEASPPGGPTSSGAAGADLRTTTTTTVLGRAVGEPPEGVECG